VQSPLTGDLDRHLSAIDAMSDLGATGECSLSNALQVCTKLFSAVPRFSTREVLLVIGSFTTCDAHPIEHTLAMVTERRTTAIVSAIGFCARTSGLEQITAATGGIYRVPTSLDQVEDLFRTHVNPPAWCEATQRMQLVPFGFARPSDEKQSFDLAELKRNFRDVIPTVTNMVCPKCAATVAKIPSYCACCGLLLMGPAHLTRSFHHLRPLNDFEPAVGEADVCAACNAAIERDQVVVCVKCGARFCVECDRFLHECLQNCPGCLRKNE
jgi:transcription initiation factor TFIIH subunit 2